MDGAEPQWWDDVANATITDEDTAGEAPPDRFERCFKVVTTADNVYGYQTLTFADEFLLDAGVTVVSFSCWVYCASSNMASIGIYGANLGLQESAQAGAGAWELLTVENQTLNGADASIDLRLIVDTGTAWFACPMLTISSEALPWKGRDLQFVPSQAQTQLNLVNTGDVAWSDTDCTATSDALAVILQFRLYAHEANGTAGSYIALSHSDTVVGADSTVVRAIVYVLNIGNSGIGSSAIFCDDSQIVRYEVSEVDADNDVTAQAHVYGYWMWA